VASLEKAWHDAHDQAAAAEAQVQVLHARLHEAEEEIRQRERQRQEQQLAYTEAQVVLAKSEERLAALRTQHQRHARELQQHRQEFEQCQQGVSHAKSRLTESQRTMLRASAHLAQAYLDKEALERQVATLIGQREQKRQDRGRLALQAQTVRNEW